MIRLLLVLGLVLVVVVMGPAIPSAAAAHPASVQDLAVARTGFDAWIPAGIGALVLAAGIALLIMQRRGRFRG